MPSRQTSGGSPRYRTETSCFSDRRADHLRQRANRGFLRTPPRHKHLFGYQRIVVAKALAQVVQDSHMVKLRLVVLRFWLRWGGESRTHNIRLQRPTFRQLNYFPKNQDPRRAAGNRTLVTSLKGKCSTIELQPQNGGDSVCFRSVNIQWEWEELNLQVLITRLVYSQLASPVAALPETEKAPQVSFLGGLSGLGI